MKHLITTLVFLRRDDEILLAMKKHGHGKGHWNGAGGKPEPGETIEQTLVRECHEEIGVIPLDYEKVAEHEFHELYRDELSIMTAHVYLCTHWEGRPTESTEMAPQWFKLTDIPYDSMWPDDTYWLPQVLSGQKLRTRFNYYDQNVLQSHEVVEISSF